MSKISKAQRDSIQARLAIHGRIHKTFDDKRWFSTSCYLCSWASNGRTPDEAEQANQSHIKSNHPAEEAEMRSTEISPREIVSALHDHDCVMAKCACKCGCTDGPFCTLVFGRLCSVCMTREMRGDDEHGTP